MNNLSKNFRSNTITIITPLVVALVFFCFVLLFFPFRDKLQFDYDEGINLITGFMIKNGYPLYSQVSSDQPALLPYLIAAIMNIVGVNITASRILILMFSTLLVWSCAQILQLLYGSIHSILLLALIILLPFYMRLSVSIMQGLPALAMATISFLLLILWHLSNKSTWLILSGLALAISIHIKLFTGFLAPIFIIGIFITQFVHLQDHRFSINLFQPVIIWGLSFLVLSIALALILIGPNNIMAIIRPHFTSRSVESLKEYHNTIQYHLNGITSIIILGAIGVLISIINRNWWILYPTSWFIVAYLSLNYYSPVWYHQQLLVTVPLIILAAVAAGEGIRWLVQIPQTREFININSFLNFIAIISLIAVIINSYPGFMNQIHFDIEFKRSSLEAPKHQMDILWNMREFAEKTEWIVTDMPLYAVLLRKPVPPNLAFFTLKLLATNELTEDEIINTVQVYKPEQVLITRFNLPNLENYLMQDYYIIQKKRGYHLYIRNDIYESN